MTGGDGLVKMHGEIQCICVKHMKKKKKSDLKHLEVCIGKSN